MIIGGEEELGVLKEAFEAEESQFVAVYGRRRVGKTHLIRECFGERITFQHATLGIFGVATECSSWRCRADEDLGVSGHQIDLLIERADGVVNLCEMKYSAEPYVVTNKEESDWSARVDDFIKATGTNETVQFTLVTPYGLKKNTHSWVVQNVIEMTDLFK